MEEDTISLGFVRYTLHLKKYNFFFRYLYVDLLNNCRFPFTCGPRGRRPEWKKLFLWKTTFLLIKKCHCSKSMQLFPHFVLHFYNRGRGKYYVPPQIGFAPPYISEPGNIHTDPQPRPVNAKNFANKLIQPHKCSLPFAIKWLNEQFSESIINHKLKFLGKKCVKLCR